MKPGELYWINLPDRGGREQRGERPAIIWQDTAEFPNLPTVLTIPFTSQLDKLRFPGTILIRPSATNGLAVASVALVFQLGACDVRRVNNRIGQLDKDDLAALRLLAARLQQIT